MGQTLDKSNDKLREIYVEEIIIYVEADWKRRKMFVSETLSAAFTYFL